MKWVGSPEMGLSFIHERERVGEEEWVFIYREREKRIED